MTDGRPVTAPGSVRTGRAPLTKAWASQQLTDETFVAAGAAAGNTKQRVRDGRPWSREAAEGQHVLHLNVQAAHAFERIARQSNPIVLWGADNRVVQ